MKTCHKCKINIVGTRTYCPLCQNELITLDNYSDEVFPVISDSGYKSNIILKSLAFTSLVTGIISVFINITLFPQVWWSVYIIATLACTWVSFSIALSKRKKLLKYLLYQSVIITLFALFLDFWIGWSSWSITFVVPIIFTLAMVVMYTLSKVLNIHTGDYIIYLLLDALFGIIPIIFVGTDMVTTDIPSLICIITSITSVTALMVFEGTNMLNELKRRLHV